MSNNAQTEVNRTFQITKELIQDLHKKGNTVKEMAEKITTLSGIKCSVGTVNKAADFYKIDMRSKPRKNGFVFADPTVEATQPATTIEQRIEEPTEEAEVVTEESRAYSF